MNRPECRAPDLAAEDVERIDRSFVAAEIADDIDLGARAEAFSDWAKLCGPPTSIIWSAPRPPVSASTADDQSGLSR